MGQGDNVAAGVGTACGCSDVEKCLNRNAATRVVSLYPCCVWGLLPASLHCTELTLCVYLCGVSACVQEYVGITPVVCLRQGTV
jgi:hypothetical protein